MCDRSRLCWSVTAARSALLLGLFACKAADPGPELQIVGESTRRLGDPVPRESPWFDGTTVTLVAARGEPLGIQVLHRGGGPVTLAIAEARVAGFAVDAVVVKRPSTSMYGGSHGAGSYGDGLTPAAAPATDPAYFEITSDVAGRHTGELVVGARHVPVILTIADVQLAPLPAQVWAFESPRELAWATGADAPPATPSAGERACVQMARGYGVLLAPNPSLADWPARKDMFAGIRDVPVDVDDDPAKLGDEVRDWIAATRGTGQVPFSIPIDEPSTAEARHKVRVLADLARAAGGGPETFRFAVTDVPRAEYGDAIDLYISARAAHLEGDRYARWTYNGAPPLAGAMVVDAEQPGMRTWGWIAWRWKIPVWYIWEGTYWHDRHNRHGAPLPGRRLDAVTDAVSFDDGEDHGNLDGVIVLPAPDGCRPTLRLAALRRGLYDRALLDRAAHCVPAAAAQLAAELVPSALGDASARTAWPSDEATWERARRKLLELAHCD
jgi:hypothetical protein